MVPQLRKFEQKHPQQHTVCVCSEGMRLKVLCDPKGCAIEISITLEGVKQQKKGGIT